MKNNYAKRPERQIKIKAKNMVLCALKSGKLSKNPCEVCGETEVHGHHDDYSKPLIVRWLCRKHHLEYHKTAISQFVYGEDGK